METPCERWSKNTQYSVECPGKCTVHTPVQGFVHFTVHPAIHCAISTWIQLEQEDSHRRPGGHTLTGRILGWTALFLLDTIPVHNPLYPSPSSDRRAL